MKSHVRVDVIGGGVAGAGKPFHLAGMGWPDARLHANGKLRLATHRDRVHKHQKHSGAVDTSGASTISQDACPRVEVGST